jgi:hypothetical protein
VTRHPQHVAAGEGGAHVRRSRPGQHQRARAECGAAPLVPAGVDGDLDLDGVTTQPPVATGEDHREADLAAQEGQPGAGTAVRAGVAVGGTVVAMIGGDRPVADPAAPVGGGRRGGDEQHGGGEKPRHEGRRHVPLPASPKGSIARRVPR